MHEYREFHSARSGYKNKSERKDWEHLLGPELMPLPIHELAGWCVPDTTHTFPALPELTDCPICILLALKQGLLTHGNSFGTLLHDLKPDFIQ